MAFVYRSSKGKLYYLHQRETLLKNGRLHPIPFFAEEIKLGLEIDHLPEGYEIVETSRGLPHLRQS